MINASFGAFQIGGKDDGVTLNARLLVVDSDVTGIGVYRDSINNVSFGVRFSGKVHATGFGTTHQLFALAGQPIKDLVGAPNIPTLTIDLQNVWGTEGSANYTLWMDTPRLDHHSGLVKVAWTEA